MLYDKDRLLLIAGPCSLETSEVCTQVAEELARLRDRHPRLNIVFKGSFDKANRTSLEANRGPGLERGLEMLAAVRERFAFPILTDFHTPDQVVPLGEVCDVLQVPAFLCRQTDLLVAAAKSGCVVNVKKGQFLSPQEMPFVVRKLESSGAAEVWLTERGSSFGYQNLVVDMRSFAIMGALGHPTVMDATHSVQLPGAGGGQSGGKREYVPLLARAALAAGANGLFMETHPDPDAAISDGASQVRLSDFATVVEAALRIWEAARDC